jgi:hypothetical protein
MAERKIEYIIYKKEDDRPKSSPEHIFFIAMNVLDHGQEMACEINNQKK